MVAMMLYLSYTLLLGKEFCEFCSYRAQAGRLEYRTDKNGVIHATIGRVSFDVKQFLENYASFSDAINKARPSSAKGRYIKSIYLSSTMGPGIKIDPNLAQQLDEE